MTNQGCCPYSDSRSVGILFPAAAMLDQPKVRECLYWEPFSSQSKLTQEHLGWRPVQRGLIQDLEQGSYFLERSRYAKPGQC
jgi:hypothetical protein